MDEVSIVATVGRLPLQIIVLPAMQMKGVDWHANLSLGVIEISDMARASALTEAIVNVRQQSLPSERAA